MYKRKFTKMLAFLLLFSMLLNMILPVSAFAAEQDAIEPEDFSCWTMNGTEKIMAVPTDGEYVLTIPYDMSPLDVVVYFEGTITVASVGELVLTGNMVTGAFDNENTTVTLTGNSEDITYTIVLVVEEPPVVETPFSCWTTNGETRINGIYSETDNKYVLTIPYDMESSDMVVYFEGTITTASVGELVLTGNMVTGAFDNENTTVTLTGNSEDITYTIVLVVEEPPVVETPFSCWTTNGETRINGVYSETDNKYVLTIPYDMEAADVVVYFTGTVTEATSGTLDEENSQVTGAFTNGNEVTLTGDENSYTIVLVVEEPPAVETPFSCWIMNGEDKIDGVLSEEDGKYHLEVPADIELAEIVLNFTGVIKDTTEGEIVEKTITGAFAEETEVTLIGSDSATTYTVVLDPYPVDERDFSCFTYDEKENPVNGYWSDKDEIWYLFVPSTVNISEMPLFYTGSISEVSEGELDMFESTVTGAFSKSGDQVILTAADDTKYTIQVMQSDLPSVHIVLNGTTLNEIHKDKDEKHTGNNVYIMDPNGSYDLAAEDNVEMKGRGNSTWGLFEKKGYQIKFDKKTSVLGMGKAKKWVLLANADDDSMMRTTLTFRMAKNLDMAFVPSFEYIDLWIDGEYRGTYIIGDKVEPGDTRLDLQEDTGVIFEQDEGFYADEDYWFYSEWFQKHFVMKEIVEEEDAYIEAAMADFEKSVDELAEYLYFTPSSEATLKELSAIIDVDSFIKYYLIVDYLLNNEAVVSSFYWHKDGPEDVIHLGPIWDFDNCMGNDPNANENYADNHVLFHYLLAIPEFYERTLELKDQYWSYLEDMKDDAVVIKAMIEDSAAMNYLRWDELGKPSNKYGDYFADTFDDAVDAVKNWLEDREEEFTVQNDPAIYTTVSADFKEMQVYLDAEANSNVRFAVWSRAGGQDDLFWYEAERNSDGILCANVDLVKHNETGVYIIHAYENGNQIAWGQSYVKDLYEPDCEISAIVSDDCDVMEITYEDSLQHENVHFAVWSDVGGQDDLHWYAAQKNAAGQWTYTVDLRGHNSAGTYNIHVYSIDNKVYTKQIEHTEYVEKAAASPVSVMVSENCKTMKITFADNKAHENIHFAVWSDVGGQDDLHWYAAQKNAADQWEYFVDLQEHNSAGTYNIHVYSIDNKVYTKQIEHIEYVEKAAAVSPVSVTVSENSETMSITFTDNKAHENIHFAVWSEVGGQDDLHWYAAQKNAAGQWTYSVDLRNHNSAGIYNIHVYSIDNRVYTKQIEHTEYVEKAAVSPVSVTISENSEIMSITFADNKAHENIHFAVWSEVGGQDDLHWYAAQKNAAGQWTYAVNLRDHNSVGKYNIHVYSIDNMVYTKQIEYTITVAV